MTRADLGAPSRSALLHLQSGGPPRVVGAAQARVWLEAAVRQGEGQDETPLEALRRGARWVFRWGGRSLSSPLSWEQRQSLVRDLRRHFPHFSERADALTRTARSGPIWHALADPSSRAFALRIERHGPDGLHCRLPASRRWMLRDVAGEGGRRSVGIAPPWLPANVAGINDAGLCGAVVVETPLFPTRGVGKKNEAMAPEATAPGWLLLDQCLERCDRVERALAWCKRRPGGGRARLSFADAAGDARVITLEGNGRVISAPAPTPTLEPPAAPRSADDLEIRLDPTTREFRIRAPEHGESSYGFAAL